MLWTRLSRHLNLCLLNFYRQSGAVIVIVRYLTLLIYCQLCIIKGNMSSILNRHTINNLNVFISCSLFLFRIHFDLQTMVYLLAIFIQNLSLMFFNNTSSAEVFVRMLEVVVRSKYLRPRKNEVFKNPPRRGCVQ